MGNISLRMRILLVTFACIGTYLALVFVLIEIESSLANALRLLQGPVEGPLVILLIHACAVGTAAVVGSNIWYRSRTWTRRMQIALVAVLASTVAVFGAWYGFGIWLWSSVHYYWDSDTANCALDTVGERIKVRTGVALPRSAREVHAVMAGGINPVMFVSIQASAEEAREFTGALLNRWGLRRSDSATGEPPSWVCESLHKVWWHPNPDLPWWYADTSAERFFIQIDPSRDTVLVAIFSR